jgi:putative transcriptional regulator
MIDYRAQEYHTSEEVRDVPRIKTKARQLRLKKQLELERPVSVQEVAEKAGIDRAALTRIELGKTTRIDFDTLLRLCAFYGVGVGDILEYDPNDKRGSSRVPVVSGAQPG